VIPRDLSDDLRLVVITDTKLASPRSVLEVVQEALQAGAPAIQLRNKGDAVRDVMELGRAIRAATREHGALFTVNDRLDLALALEADGVHLGPNDLPVAAARRVTPAEFIIGRSADDPAVARQAVADGADYIGCGAVYATGTKADAGDVIGIEGLQRIAAEVSVPVVAIGGITVDRAPAVAAGGRVAGVAVVGAVMCAADVGAAVRGLLHPFMKGRRNREGR